jgi:hypothetical protein
MTVLPDVLVLTMGMGTDVHVDEGISDLDEDVFGTVGVVGVVLGGVVSGVVVVGGSVGGVVIGVVGVVVGVVTGVVVGVVVVGTLVVVSIVGELLTVSMDLVVSCTGVVMAGESPVIITGP